MAGIVLSVLILVALPNPCLADEKNWTLELNAIAEKCTVPHGNLQWVDGAVQWLETDKLTYEQATSAIGEMKTRGVPTKQGFVASDNNHPSRPVQGADR